MNNLRIIFSQNLKYYRISKNYSQTELAETINLTDKYISDLERAKFSPSLETIEHIAKALEIKPSQLLEENEQASKIPTRLDQKTGKRKRKKI